jgi:hypothetical protein
VYPDQEKTRRQQQYSKHYTIALCRSKKNSARPRRRLVLKCFRLHIGRSSVDPAVVGRRVVSVLVAAAKDFGPEDVS